MADEGQRLDPQDWTAFSQEMHDLLDTCLTRMQSARDLPWQPKPADMRDGVALRDIAGSTPTAKVFDRISDEIMPYATGNTHPRFFGWVHGTGTPVAVGAEMVAATMNSNCGGRDHGAAEVERAVIDWLCRTADMPQDAFGILTSGTSQATILAMSAARRRKFGADVLKNGIRAYPDIRVYVADGGHSCIAKALEVLGYGSESLTKIPVLNSGQMDMDRLKETIAQDRANGLEPLAVVGTAGSVNLGYFDPLDDLASYCKAEGIWFHVDAAFGFWALLADAPWCDLAKGIGQADSIACDLHKWMSVPYDCGACLISDRDLHRATFTARPSYLASQDAGLAGGDLWFCDYGLELSRGFKALKVWTVVQTIGTDALGAYVTDNCKQAALMGQLAAGSEVLDLARPVVSNVCCFWPKAGDPDKIAATLQLSGDAVFSTTLVDGKPCLRAAIVNHRCTQDDIRLAIAAVEREVRAAI
ncbi:pyridoxal phosphate-dependent decarboxylase family protein [Litoreibacter roseus]|uniref:Cytochrome d ubiquinol oxidase subunit I n=1 Tax=Litoreibacter roseus TaxID=2601869 RepID=A0A6N6JKA8_9RHOB|nr:aminotransferase class V-fold PLP-dependent enzyme [Litoreibacter roseus]GFE66290.1 cytochrome d ubiquinol oxidase subunit I [Litoreibacter roseus]